jgi:hypothetical protein
MTDERPTDDRWLTYIEAGELLGLSPEAVRSIARRQKWPRQSPNAIGKVVKILVPADRLRPVGHRRERPVATNGHDRSTDRSELREMAELFIEPLREQLERAERRAEAAEDRAREAERRLRELHEKLEAEMTEHRQMVALLLKRRSWWPWRR